MDFELPLPPDEVIWAMSLPDADEDYGDDEPFDDSDLESEDD